MWSGISAPGKSTTSGRGKIGNASSAELSNRVSIVRGEGSGPTTSISDFRFCGHREGPFARPASAQEEQGDDRRAQDAGAADRPGDAGEPHAQLDRQPPGEG